jgi:hypothetical protein
VVIIGVFYFYKIFLCSNFSYFGSDPKVSAEILEMRKKLVIGQLEKYLEDLGFANPPDFS